MQEINKLKSPQNQEYNRMSLPDPAQIQNTSALTNSQFVKKFTDSQVSSLFSIDYEIIKKRYVHQGILGRGRDSYLQIFNVLHILVDTFTNEKRVLQVYQSLPLDVFLQKLDNLYKASFQSFVSNQQQILGFSTKRNDDKTFDLLILYDFENFNSNLEDLIQSQIIQGKKQFGEEELWDFAYFLVDSFYLGGRNSQEFLDISPINIYFTEDQQTKKRKYSITNLGFQGNKKQDKKFYLPSDRFFQPLKPNEKKKAFDQFSKAQIFQVGMIILYMASLEDPNQLYSEILQSETKSLNAELLQQRIQQLGYSEKLKAFLQQLLSLREEKRITIEELITTEKGNQLLPRQYFYHKGKIGDQETYDGFVIKNQNQFVPHGLGYLESNNQHFKGNFDQGEFTGNGVWHDGNSKFIYGKFVSNEISHGIYINKNQFIFTGSLKDFKPSGGDGIYHSLSNNLQDDLFFCQGKFGDNLKMITGKKYYKNGIMKDDSSAHSTSKQKTIQQQSQQQSNNQAQQQAEQQQKQPQQQQIQKQKTQQDVHQKAKILQYSTLESGKKQVIKTGNALQSENKLYFLLMQENGNLALYKTHQFIAKNMLWETGTKGNGNYLRLQDDGNLVVYDVQDQPLWASNTNDQGSQPYQFICQGDGNLVIYDSSQTPIWTSNTQQLEEENENNHQNTIFSEGKIPQNGTLQANNKCGYVRMQEDGNLVVYDNENNPLWSSNSQGQGEMGNYKCFVQNDGNLVVYDKNKQPIWASNTNHQGTKPYRLIMQDDCNLVLYDHQNQALWSSLTNQQ